MQNKSGGQGGCENAKKRVGVRSGRGQGGCVQIIKVIVKIKKSRGSGGSGRGGGGGGGVRVDVYKEFIEVIVKMKNKKKSGRGVRSGIGSWSGVSRLGVVVDVVYGGCQPRIEGIDKCK